MSRGGNFGRPATPGKVHHCSKFSPFVDNGSHRGSLESQSFRNGFVTLSILIDVNYFVSHLFLNLARPKDRAIRHRAIAANPEATTEDTNKKSHYDLCRAIKQAKGQYRNKMKNYYIGSNARRMWQGLRSIKDYKGRHIHDLPTNVSPSPSLLSPCLKLTTTILVPKNSKATCATITTAL